jgi:disulfide bond formation protein DsbB
MSFLRRNPRVADNNAFAPCKLTVSASTVRELLTLASCQPSLWPNPVLVDLFASCVADFCERVPVIAIAQTVDHHPVSLSESNTQIYRVGISSCALSSTAAFCCVIGSEANLRFL